MNIHQVVSGYVAAVNPWITGTYLQSTGYTTSADGDRVPAYAAPISIQIQMQALTYLDLVQTSGINLGGEARAMYVSGNIEGIDRAASRGGDLITLPDGTNWLVVHVLENWNETAGWTKFAVVKQAAS